jgi:hypothetical protein
MVNALFMDAGALHNCGLRAYIRGRIVGDGAIQISALLRDDALAMPIFAGQDRA